MSKRSIHLALKKTQYFGKRYSLRLRKELRKEETIARLTKLPLQDFIQIVIKIFTA